MPQIPRDVLAFAVSFAYVAVCIASSELIRRRKGYGDEFTRKIVHVTIGLWIVPTLFLYTKWYWAALLPGLAVIGNSLSLRYRLIRAIERDVKGDFGTVFFPLSFVICLLLFFPRAHPEAAAVGIVMMALGDAAAAIVGKAYGKRPYRFLGARKTLEGSAAMFAVSTVAAFAAVLIFGGSVREAAVVSLCCAAVGTFLEAAGRNGLDNLTVPVLCSSLAFMILDTMRGSAQ